MLPVQCNKNWVRLPFLLDSGAQCSILDFSAIKDYNAVCNPIEKGLISLGFNKSVKGYAYNTNVLLSDLELTHVKFFCAPSLQLKITVNGISETISKLNETVWYFFEF